MVNSAPEEADKELNDILDNLAEAIESGDMVLDIKEMETIPALLAWRDKGNKAIYHRLAAEAVEVLRASEGDLDKTMVPLQPMKVIELSKLKAIMEIKEL